MATPGRYGSAPLGWQPYLRSFWNNGGAVTKTIAASGSGLAFRWRADSTRDIKGVYINWQSIAVPADVECRIETVDLATGKPTGTLYDAAATKTLTPSDAGTDGWQLFQFDVLPTTGLAVNAAYVALFLPAGASTVLNARTHVDASPWVGDSVVLHTTANVSTRTNLAEQTLGPAIFSLVFEDDAEEAPGTPFPFHTTFDIYGTRACAAKFTVPTGMQAELSGVALDMLVRTGTPDALRVRIVDDANTTVKAALLDKELTGGMHNAGGFVRFETPVTLAAGTYRAVVEQRTDANAASATTSGNNWRFYVVQARAAALVATGHHLSTTTDYTAGTPTWTDTTRSQPGIYPLLRDFTATGGGGASVYNLME